MNDIVNLVGQVTIILMLLGLGIFFFSLCLAGAVWCLRQIKSKDKPRG